MREERQAGDVELRGPALEVYYNRELRKRYDFDSGDELPLDDDVAAVGAASAPSEA